MRVKPLKDYLLVKIVEKEETTKSGIILAGCAKEDSNVAKIIETPDFVDDDKDILIKGDKIIINPNTGTKVKLDNEEFLIIAQSDVYAVLSY